MMPTLLFLHFCLQVSINKNKVETFTLKDIRIHKNFVKMGKASIELSEPRIRIMLANTPPDQLILFLKTLVTKLGCQKLKPQISARNKLLSLKPHTFDTISPLQVNIQIKWCLICWTLTCWIIFRKHKTKFTFSKILQQLDGSSNWNPSLQKCQEIVTNFVRSSDWTSTWYLFPGHIYFPTIHWPTHEFAEWVSANKLFLSSSSPYIMKHLVWKPIRMVEFWRRCVQLHFF